MSIGDFPESLSQAVLAGIMLVGRLGVLRRNTNNSSTHIRPILDYHLKSIVSDSVSQPAAAPSAPPPASDAAAPDSQRLANGVG